MPCAVCHCPHTHLLPPPISMCQLTRSRPRLTISHELHMDTISDLLVVDTEALERIFMLNTFAVVEKSSSTLAQELPPV